MGNRPIDRDRGPLILSAGSPLETAKEFVAREWSAGGLATLHCQNDIFYGYDGTHYPEIAKCDMRAKMYMFLDGAKDYDKKGQAVPFNPNTVKVNDAYDAVKSLANLSLDRAAPIWLGDAADLPASEIIVCANGLLHLPTGELLKHTPEFFTHTALNFEYVAGATAPEWKAFLRRLWPDDEASISTLQEMAGLFLTADTKQQKAFLLVGPRRSGKGTIARTLSALLGQHNVCGPTLNSMAGNFGLQNMINKRLAVISDARLGGKSDLAVITERFLSITGEDAIDVARKNLGDWHGQLQVRFLVLTNELPRLLDSSGALASRFVILVLTESFYGREDHGLSARLQGELPGVLNWAIEGWRRLNGRGYFLQPDSAVEMMEELQDLSSPIGAFLRECCVETAGKEIEAGELFKAWRWWGWKHGRGHSGTAQTFGRDLRAATAVRMTRPNEGGSRVRKYEGIDLTPETRTAMTARADEYDDRTMVEEANRRY